MASTTPDPARPEPAPSVTPAVPVPAAEDAVAALAGRIRRQIAFRILIAVVLLAGTAAIHFHSGPGLLQYDFRAVYAVIAVAFATAFPVMALVGRIRTVRALEALSALQVLVDVASTTAVVYFTGGYDSPVVFLYGLTIINSSTVLYRRGAVLTAATSVIAYGALVDLTYYQVLKPFAPDVLGTSPLESREAFYRVGVTAVSFLFTGLLASYFADQLRRTGQELEERRIDLRELQAITKNIVENIGSGLLTVDRAGRITSFNRSAEEITGLALQAVFGRPLDSLFPAVAARIRSSDREEGARYEEAFLRSDGASLALGFSYSPLRNDRGTDIGTIVIFQDLTELREMEIRLKREERLAAVGRLAAGIAHEIRNPLASISGSIEMLKSTLELPVEDKRLMEIILRETDRLDALITEFLAYVKPVKHRRSRVDLQSVLAETAESLRSSDDAREIAITLPPEGTVPDVRGDRDHLKQLAWNLLLNAVQAVRGRNGGKGAVEIRLVRRGARDSDAVTVEIVDDGSGIASEDLPRIFEPFFTTKERGTGLGLAMVHKIVEGHGGNIEVESTPGNGSIFRITLPRWLDGDFEEPVTGSRPAVEADTPTAKRGGL